MQKLQFTLRGKPAVVVIALLLVFGGWRARAARADLETGAAQQVARVLRAEYAREQLAGTVAGALLTPAGVDSLLATQDVTFPSIEARGGAGAMVVRVEVLVHGLPPRDGRDTRYYRMRRSLVSGWHIDRETNAFGYYTTLF